MFAALAAGCAQTPAPGQTTALAAPAANPAPERAVAAPPPTVPQVGSPPARALPPDPAELLGAGPTTVETRLGRPAHVWREDPGAMWQYVKDVCVLSIYLHGAETGLKVIAIQARNRLDGKPADASCYAKFVL